MVHLCDPACTHAHRHHSWPYPLHTSLSSNQAKSLTKQKGTFTSYWGISIYSSLLVCQVLLHPWVLDEFHYCKLLCLLHPWVLDVFHYCKLLCLTCSQNLWVLQIANEGFIIQKYKTSALFKVWCKHCVYLHTSELHICRDIELYDALNCVFEQEFPLPIVNWNYVEIWICLLSNNVRIPKKTVYELFQL